MMAAGGGGGEEYYHQYGYGRGPGDAPNGLLVAVVLGLLLIAGPLLLGDADAIKEALRELLSPVGLLLLPLALVILIRVLSSDRGAVAAAFALGGTPPDAVHRVGGSPVGVAILLLLIFVMLYYRTALFGGDDE